MTQSTDRLDQQHIRRIFGAFPTGVVAVAAEVEGQPVGLAASSFTSVSLEPPLVSICIAHTSTTWPLLSPAPRLEVSVLAAHQEAAARQLSGRGVDRFADLSWRASEHGAVFLDGATTWLETSIERQVRAGDHDIVLLRVHDVEGAPADDTTHPLIFHASTFRRLDRGEHP